MAVAAAAVHSFSWRAVSPIVTATVTNRLVGRCLLLAGVVFLSPAVHSCLCTHAALPFGRCQMDGQTPGNGQTTTTAANK